MLARLFAPTIHVHAHCDLPCGVYDPAQARIEAEWTDYFKAPHFEKYPNLHTLFNEATKLAGTGGTKGSMDAAAADQLLAKIDEIAEIFWETKKS